MNIKKKGLFLSSWLVIKGAAKQFGPKGCGIYNPPLKTFDGFFGETLDSLTDKVLRIYWILKTLLVQC